ncbi:hypothetical protein [Clostridioides difficile]|nr:hypothetical protein [Clostridioides difficile]DAN94497.1 MAG TPA: hypothetical protein [Bacteriophage sp.]AXU65970.1 hypothetical protein CDIF28669_03394 [Clostridioides difficile]AXU84462.1 hypothetical protein CDIF29632_03357 [Clostridioides difficile]EQH19633.1 hypothetical protein QKY_3225 [Clostridioides difficile DA00211]MCR8775799.1 hypothetical protein [Clostridioides difficile]
MIKKIIVFFKERKQKKEYLEEQAFSNKYISYSDYKYLLEQIK